MTTIALISMPVYSIDFDHDHLYGSWDSIISYGTIYRLQSSTDELIGIANGGTAFSVNGDDGNLNYHTGLVSSTVKLTTELELNYKNTGAFIRVAGFKNFYADEVSADTERTPLTDKAINLSGEGISLLDAYIWTDLEFGTIPVSLYIGEQVISWGESVFIQNSINVTNPVDISKLRFPGAELKEALIPVGIVSVAFEISNNISLETYWQYDYERTLLDSAGTYFSTNDFAAVNGSFVTLGFGHIPDYLRLNTDISPVNVITDLPGTLISGASVSANRVTDHRPQQGNEYGITLRGYLPHLNGTEFGLYHIKYHSRLPIINAISATPAAAIGSPPLNNPMSPASYFTSYPEDIYLYGISFNTQPGNSGWAMQGEYSFRDNAPLQVDDVELITAALHFEIFGRQFASQAGIFSNGSIIPGAIRRAISQWQISATRIISGAFNSDQALLLGELAITHIHNMPDKDHLRLEAPGTNLPGNTATAALLSAVGTNIPVETNDFADPTSWGYRLAARVIYNNVIGAINLSPYINWRHDISGNTPGPGGNFIEGFKQISLGLTAEYQNSWRAELSYTNFFGAGSQNLLQDRDFMTFNISYSF